MERWPSLLTLALVIAVIVAACVHDERAAVRESTHRDDCKAAGGEQVRSSTRGVICAKLTIIDTVK